MALSIAAQAFASGDPSPRALTSETLRSSSQSVRRYKLDAQGRPAYLKRFSDGPRRVAVARGANKARAEALGIGSSDFARKLLHVAAPPELVRAVTGEATRDLLWPVVGGHFGRGFGFTRRLRPELQHNGVDIGAPEGATVRAAADGLVVYSDNGLKGYGNCVMILHPNGRLTLYAHNQRTLVPAGYRVRRGERIALVGKTGYAWGPHLHFELRDNGRLRNPERLFSGRNSDEVRKQVAHAPTGPLKPQRVAAANVTR
ncbi:MAG TPA: M23 family metallopeptidase [Polyangiales bacterium]|nr:M23 family metallopeptidase [Polyangiales bacterium]